MQYVLMGCISVVSAVLLALMGCKIMQILQLSSYRARGVFAWLKATGWKYYVRYFAAAFFSGICMLVYVGCFWSYAVVRYLGLLFYAAHAVLFIVITAKQKDKTPLKCTPRIFRLAFLSAVLFGGASFGLLFVGTFLPVHYAMLGLLPLFVPFIVLLAHWILLPLETLHNAGYERRAAKKLRQMPSLVRIGITGSYGKTTAKNILAAMLAQKYNVYATPASYNTPLGIARAVNYGLTAEHEVFIAEMGARYKGDIARLCKTVAPNYGVITAVGKQHLETFGSAEAIAAAKYELVEGLAPSGVAVFSADNEVTRQMYARTFGEKRLAGGEEIPNTCVSYTDVSFDARGTSFTLRRGKESATVVTRLLGRHVPSLTAVCAAVAAELGVSLPQIAQAVADMPPVEHRLQCLQNGDVTVLDDAYNSNPEGARNALEVLQAFDGTRIVITPGLVEMGAEEQEANAALGRAVFGKADYAFFVGARAQALMRGALDEGMPAENVFVCATRDEAVQKSGEIPGKKTILFENDLPDNL